jgi:hypothetical protein
MKLDKWPEEIECDGWRWESLPGYKEGIQYYARKEKLHTPPTMREIMEHLLLGGWVRNVACNTHYYYRLDSISGDLLSCEHSQRFWARALFLLKNCNPQRIFLIQSNEWFEGGEK